MSITFYLCGPMRGLPSYNFPAFIEAGDDLSSRGYDVLCPARSEIEMGFDPDRDTFCDGDLEKAILKDIHMVLQSDALCVLPGWHGSTGANAEIAVGRWSGKDLYEYHGPGKDLTRGLTAVDTTDNLGSSSQELHEDILEEALRLTSGDRQDQYGPPNADFGRTAQMWTALFGRVYLPHEVAMAMACLKLSRITHSPEKRDNWTDLAGYGRCGWMCVDAAPANPMEVQLET